jgi:hypothetical protein
MPRSCRPHAMPRPYRSGSDLSRPRHSAAWERHGVYKLASDVQRQHVGDLSAFGFFRLPRGVPRSIPISEAVRIFPSTTRIFTKYTSLSGNGRGTAWLVWINTAGERHGMCELALNGSHKLSHVLWSYTVHYSYLLYNRRWNRSKITRVFEIK